MSVPAYVPPPLQGQCLCGQVKFEVRTRHLRLYQCHCSLCRRQSGSSSNTAALVPLGQFRWLAGEKKVRSWVKDSGFRSDFCRTCGSPVPNQVRDLPMMWVPAGLLDEGEGLSVAAHLCLSSSAPWDQPRSRASVTRRYRPWKNCSSWCCRVKRRVWRQELQHGGVELIHIHRLVH
ncbi:GFA family protein [Zoogloea sp.]|uniref:GFA family protein n=1 Tax=Zoogloea sp. TaxID=49181 RepID=UPI0035AE5FD6